MEKAMKETAGLEDLIMWDLDNWHSKRLGGKGKCSASFLYGVSLDNYSLKYYEREKVRKVVIVVENASERK